MQQLAQAPPCTAPRAGRPPKKRLVPSVAAITFLVSLTPLAWGGPQEMDAAPPIRSEVEQITTLNHAPVTSIAVLIGRAEISVNTSSAPGKRIVVLTKPVTAIAIWGRATKRIAS